MEDVTLLEVVNGILVCSWEHPESFFQDAALLEITNAVAMCDLGSG